MKNLIKFILIAIIVIISIVIAVLLIFGNMAKQKTEKYYEYSNPFGVIEKNIRRWVCKMSQVRVYLSK